MSRRLRISTILAFALALLLAACGNDEPSGSGGQQAQTGPRTLTIWLMEGSAPPQVIEAVNADFKTAHPNDTVKVQLQQ
jgi:N,N'-diacetylchitobiose transport system substrate-binding protein